MSKLLKLREWLALPHKWRRPVIFFKVFDYVGAYPFNYT